MGLHGHTKHGEVLRLERKKRRGEVIHLILFFITIVYAYISEGSKNYYERDIYLVVRIEGDIQIENDRNFVKVRVLESEIDEIQGRKALLISRNLHLENQGIYQLFGSVRVNKGKVYIYSYGDSLAYLGEEKNVRTWLIENYSRLTKNEEVKSLGFSFLFGEPRDTAPPSLQKSFLSTGLVHLLVISGLHVGLIAGIVMKSLPKFWGMRVALLLIIMYSILIVPQEPPVLRATLMFSMFILSALSFQEVNRLAVLFFSGSVILFVFPNYVLSYSFWLSFFATLYILLALEYQTKSKFKKSLVVSVSAFGGVAPLIASFSYISPLSVLFTPIMAPVVVLYATLGVLSLISFMKFSLIVYLFNVIGVIFIKVVNIAEFFSFQIYLDVKAFEGFIIVTLCALIMYLADKNYKPWVPIASIGYLFIRSLI